MINFNDELNQFVIIAHILLLITLATWAWNAIWG